MFGTTTDLVDRRRKIVRNAESQPIVNAAVVDQHHPPLTTSVTGVSISPYTCASTSRTGVPRLFVWNRTLASTLK
jgi:hypothetical protein